MNRLDWGNAVYLVFLMCAATPVALPAQTFKTLHSFDITDGGSPYAGLVQATDGNLYGTVGGGGSYGNGALFRITVSGTLTVLHDFCSPSDCSDGRFPNGALVQAADGNLYGTASDGGVDNGYGTVFRITLNGTLTALHTFDLVDGAFPDAGLVQGTDGNFYGTTTYGGSSTTCFDGCGTVFKITPTGTLTTLHSFDYTDGAYTYVGLVQAVDGSFYGTTWMGGANHYGTAFKITPHGNLTTLHSFDFTDGAYPLGGLMQASDGNLYGTTFGGGANAYGTVFRLTTSGTLTTLYSFCSQTNCSDGQNPNAGLVQGTDGNLYGTTYYDGVTSYGTVFKITPSGTLTRLYNFCTQSGCADGANPTAALLQDTNGKFYGTTEMGGANDYGTVFSLAVGLGPFVETQPTGGKVGAAVKILGTNLTGATSVTFNGTPAAFTVKAASLIKATVPAGATSGTVQVVTPSGTLSSNVPFRVAP